MRRTGQIDRIYTARVHTKFLDFQRQTAPLFVETIIKHFQPRSVIDVGCGPGEYLAEFARRGVEIFGVEGARSVYAVLQIPRDKVRIHDLAHPLRLDRRYDLCICTEVAEHIDARHALTLVETLCRASDTIFFSAATPGQGGDDHVNEQPHEYWIDRFAQRGFSLDRLTTATIREELAARGMATHWIPNNTLIFRRRRDSGAQARGLLTFTDC